MPFEYCYKYRGNCFICSGIYCVGLIELSGHLLMFTPYEDGRFVRVD